MVFAGRCGRGRSWRPGGAQLKKQPTGRIRLLPSGLCPLEAPSKDPDRSEGPRCAHTHLHADPIVPHLVLH